ncbi:MAG TPA: FMN-binding negative transcriptional regulator [Chitinophagaceae bacterium]|nr:FMN-binding negative transcriptional regulator [Chitinophagaceae bacterium]
MYKFSYYTEKDNEKVIAFMKENSFAIITVPGNDYPVATQIPLDIQETNGKILLKGHLMRNTDHHKAFVKNENVLVIFSGPHCYVSASWYVNPHSGSTWNYMTVHAKGKIKFGDEADTRLAVESITNKYEKPDSVAGFNKLSEEYIGKMVKAITSFTIEVESLDHVFKLSQTNDKETRENIISELRKNGNANEKAIASEMEKRIDIPKQ